MTLARSSWWPQAEQLRPGQKRRVNHDCGPGRTLLLSFDLTGYRAWCFRCGDGDGCAAPEPSLAERLERMRAAAGADAAAGSSAELPAGLVEDVGEWPPAARLWLYRAGLGRDDIGRLGAKYHPATDRVVVPVLVDGRVVFWQARALDGRQPKYLAPPVDKGGIVPRFGSGPAVTLTEDLLSAYKVGLVGEGWCLLGTRAGPGLLALLLAARRPVNIWLDPDAAGRRAAGKLIRQLRGYGLEVRDILSRKDPKLHTRDEIKEILS